MGLDMYMSGRKFFWFASAPGAERKEGDKRVKSLDVELGYWRKHPNLHGYIVNTFANGNDDCKEIELSAANLRDIIAAIKADRLPHTEGFFFGSSTGDKDETDDAIKQLNGALDWLNESDPAPVKTETVTEGPGFRAVSAKVDPAAERKPQNITRSVIYEASW